MVECPSCGEQFDRPGLHWWHGTCPYPEISARQRELFVGLLMGDGSIPTPSGGNTCVFRLPMANRRFLRWFDEQMGILTTGVSLNKTASELAHRSRETGFSPTAEASNYHDMYAVWSRTHPFLDELRDHWYDNDGAKTFPDDLSLTPRLAKLWYVSDGYLDVGRWGRPRVEIKARNEADRATFLCDLFRERGFVPTFHHNELRFTCDDTERLLSWLGESPPGFAYKWELDSRERYREPKRRAYEATRPGRSTVRVGDGALRAPVATTPHV
jgi:hypothetical protein